MDHSVTPRLTIPSTAASARPLRLGALVVALPLLLAAILAGGIGADGVGAQTPPGGHHTCTVQLDLMLVLDGSLSIPADDFNTNVRAFARQVVAGLDVGASAARVGVTQFSSEGDARLEIGLSADGAGVRAAIDGMQQIGNETDIQEGIAVGMRELRDNGRADVPWVLVVVTDGRDTQPGDLAREADAARAAGAIIFAVGVGPEVDPDQLATIASDPELVFTVGDFLALVTLVDQLAQLFCAPPVPTGAQPPSMGTGPTTQELPPARCDDATNSGGAGVTTRTYDLGATAGTFRFSYNTYTIPDRIDITYEGRTIFSTGGFVGESKEVSVAFGPGAATTVTVTVTGNTDSGTIWNYVLRCPGTAPAATPRPSASPTATPRPSPASPRPTSLAGRWRIDAGCVRNNAVVPNCSMGETTLQDRGGEYVSEFRAPLACRLDGIATADASDAGRFPTATLNLRGTLTDRMFTGEINICTRPPNRGQPFWRMERLTLTLSADGNVLEGSYHFTQSNVDVPYKLTRIR